MIKPRQVILSGIIVIAALYVVVVFASPFKKNKQQLQNHAPAVKITSPANNSYFDWKTQINYTITVSDKEDGDTRYDEINPKEVLLQVRYTNDEAKIKAILQQGIENDPPGLLFIRTSNCFNCHSFNDRLIGPSFYDISQRYTPATANVALLTKRIRAGTTGVWGKVSMPSHPELSKEQTEKMVKWILDNAKDPEVHYAFGTEGFFRVSQAIPGQKNGTYILTASYIDHGLKEDSTKPRLKGQDVIVIRARQ